MALKKWYLQLELLLLLLLQWGLFRVRHQNPSRARNRIPKKFMHRLSLSKSVVHGAWGEEERVARINPMVYEIALKIAVPIIITTIIYHVTSYPIPIVSGILSGWGYSKSHTITPTTPSGTIDVVNDNQTISGNSTNFTEWYEGDKIQLPDTNWYIIKHITDDDTLTIDNIYPGATLADQAYAMKNIHLQMGFKVYFGSGTDGTETIDDVVFGKVYCNSRCNADFTDIRWIDISENNHHYWLQKKVDSDYAIFWAEVREVTSSCVIYINYGNAGASSLSNGYDTFVWFEDFTPRSVDAKYLTNWTKSGNNPLGDLSSQAWITGIYSQTTGRIYLFRNDCAGGIGNWDTTIECFSFDLADAGNFGNWTDHGTVFTTTETWNGEAITGIEWHSFIFETQAMADAREGVGEGLGTRKWRAYYCAVPEPQSLSQWCLGFATADDDDLLSWTPYPGNPVYSDDTIKTGYGDIKAAVYEDRVWGLIIASYGESGSLGATPQSFIISDDGIKDWEIKSLDMSNYVGSVCNPITCTIVSFANEGIFMVGRPIQGSAWEPPEDQLYLNAHFTPDGNVFTNWSGNPILTATRDTWEHYFGWETVIVDKDGSADLNDEGTYYLYYVGTNEPWTEFKIALATSTTLSEVAETTDLTGMGWKMDFQGASWSIVGNRLRGSRVSPTSHDRALRGMWSKYPIASYNRQPYVVEGAVEFSQNDEDNNYFVCVNGMLENLRMKAHGDGYIYYTNNGGAVKSSVTYEADVEYKFRIIVREESNTGDYWFNGTLLAADQAYENTTADPYSIQTNFEQGSGIFYVDYYFTRKLLTTPPTHGAWGSEEEAPKPSGGGPNTKLILPLELS